MAAINRPRVPRQFVADLELYLDDDGDTEAGKEEVRDHFRAMLCDDRRQEALDWVKMKADIIRARMKRTVEVEI